MGLGASTRQSAWSWARWDSCWNWLPRTTLSTEHGRYLAFRSPMFPSIGVRLAVAVATVAGCISAPPSDLTGTELTSPPASADPASITAVGGGETSRSSGESDAVAATNSRDLTSEETSAPWNVY